MVEMNIARAIATAIACTLLLVATLPTIHSYPYDPEEHSYLVEVASWRHPGKDGADLTFQLNQAETRLLLVGYGARGEVRVTDLDLGNATVLDPPSPDFLAKGAEWSHTEDRIVVWGEAREGTPFGVYDLPSYRMNTTAEWLDLVTFPEVTEVSFFNDDTIVSVAGRDEEGVSHLILIEVEKASLRWDHIWEGNHTILKVGHNDREMVIADSGGTITVIQSNTWDEFTRYRGAQKGGATSWHIPWDHGWGFGDEEGRVVVSSNYPYEPEFNISVGDGPVTGFAWTFGRSGDFVTALQITGGGSRLDGWQISPEDPDLEVPDLMCSLDISGNVTMMGLDPRGWSRVLVAMDDGTLASYRLDVRPKPPFYPTDAPDDPDGRGLEPFAAWHTEGTPDEGMHFAFNHAGTLIALQGFRSPNDLLVINRTFDVVADIQMPGGDFELVGFEWSNTDRWFVFWGTTMKPGKSSLVIQAYDVPSFKKSSSFDPQLVHDATHALWDMLFLPGDKVLALCCADDDNNYVVKLLDLGTGEVSSGNILPRGEYDMSWDGDNMVLVSDQGGIWTMSSPYDEFNRTRAGPDGRTKTVSVNVSSGWCHIDWYSNITVMAGQPREEVLAFDMDPKWPASVAWTGVPGDFMLGSIRKHRGSSIQLWRLGAGEENDWRSVGGAMLITELNSTRIVKQIEADPAFPGIMAVSFDDGTLALYHLNLAPYPAAPEELGGLDINPYIPPTDKGDGGDSNGLLWGSERDWMFPVVLASLIVVLVGVLIFLRVRTGSEDE
jgi:hypothetical protein